MATVIFRRKHDKELYIAFDEEWLDRYVMPEDVELERVMCHDCDFEEYARRLGEIVQGVPITELKVFTDGEAGRAEMTPARDLPPDQFHARVPGLVLRGRLRKEDSVG